MDKLALDGADDGTATTGRRQRHLRRLARGAGRTAVALLSALVLAGTGVGWRTAGELRGHGDNPDVLGDTPTANLNPADHATDILLVGNDSRTDARGNPLPRRVLDRLRTDSTGGSLNTDTIVVLRVPDGGARPTAVSLHRDSYVSIPGRHPEKINAVYGLAKGRAKSALRERPGIDPARVERESDQVGRRALVDAVRRLTGARIDHFAEVNLLGFALLTEAVGGVEVCLKHATSDSDSGADFRRGRQRVSGGDALSFVRQRDGLPNGDLDRIVRQQAFMASMANTMLSTGTLTDPARMRRLTEAADRSLVLDQDWDVMRFAQRMRDVSAAKIAFRTAPVVEAGARDDRGQSVVRVDRHQVSAFFADLVREVPDPRPAPFSPRLAPEPPVRLDGSAARSGTAAPAPDSDAISAAGVPCVY